MSKALAVAVISLMLVAQGKAATTDPFAYKFEMTPEEGPLNPAVEERYTAAFGQCQKLAVTTRDHAFCYEDEFARQDKRLNRAWHATSARIIPTLRGRLRAAQRQWIAERDAFCLSKSDEFRGGTIAPVVYANCRVEQTVRRTLWLEARR